MKRVLISLSFFVTIMLGDYQLPKEFTLEELLKETVSNGLIAYEIGNYESALSIFESLANKGDAEAQYLFGLMYSEGIATKQDYSKAKTWYEKAANQGFVEAQYNLGIMYIDGKGVKQDYFKAKEFFEKAAKHKNPEAQYNLRVMYANGQGVRQDKILF